MCFHIFNSRILTFAVISYINHAIISYQPCCHLIYQPDIHGYGYRVRSTSNSTPNFQVKADNGRSTDFTILPFAKAIVPIRQPSHVSKRFSAHIPSRQSLPTPTSRSSHICQHYSPPLSRSSHIRNFIAALS